MQLPCHGLSDTVGGAVGATSNRASPSSSPLPAWDLTTLSLERLELLQIVETEPQRQTVIHRLIEKRREHQRRQQEAERQVELKATKAARDARIAQRIQILRELLNDETVAGPERVRIRERLLEALGVTEKPNTAPVSSAFAVSSASPTAPSLSTVVPTSTKIEIVGTDGKTGDSFKHSQRTDDSALLQEAVIKSKAPEEPLTQASQTPLVSGRNDLVKVELEANPAAEMKVKTPKAATIAVAPISSEPNSVNATASTPVQTALFSFNSGTPPKLSTPTASLNFAPSAPTLNFTGTSTFRTGHKSQPAHSFGQTLQTGSADSLAPAAQAGGLFGKTQGASSLFGQSASNSAFGLTKSSGLFSGAQPLFGSSLPAGQTSTVTPSGAGQSALVADSAIQKHAFGQSSFGQPPFGQFGQTPQKPATSFTSTKPSFGQSSFGQPASGQPSLSQPAFGGQPSPGPAFGQPAFGHPAFGQPAFAQLSPGQASFGQVAPLAGSGGSPLGAQSNPKAITQTAASAQTTFGSSTQFGQGGGLFATPSASGQSTFGQLSQPAIR